jgi:hypothetical protein
MIHGQAMELKDGPTKRKKTGKVNFAQDLRGQDQDVELQQAMIASMAQEKRDKMGEQQDEEMK